METHKVGMNKFNRDNPFMYLLYTSNEELVEKTERTIKRMLLLYIAWFTQLLLSIIFWIVWKHNQIAIILIGIGLVAIPTYYALRIIRENQTSKIDLMIYGNEFTYMNINNEEVLANTVILKKDIGKVEVLYDSIFLYAIGFLITDMIYLLGIIIFIFK